MTTKYIYEELVIIYSEVSAVGTYTPAQCQVHLGLPSQGANNVVHVRAIGGGTSE